MDVEIKLYCLAGYLPKYWNTDPHPTALIEDIKRNAIDAWMNRLPHEEEVSFVQELSNNHPRTFNVSLKNEHALVVNWKDWKGWL